MTNRDFDSARREPNFDGYADEAAGMEAPVPTDSASMRQRRAYMPGPEEARAGGLLGSRRATLPLAAGGLVVLMGLVAWYAYESGARSVGQGSVPLIQADGSPVKMRPEQPGGMEVPHQDKLVFSRLEQDAAETGVERLLPAPEEPLPRPQPPQPEPAAALPAAPSAPLSADAPEIAARIPTAPPATMPEPVPLAVPLAAEPEPVPVPVPRPEPEPVPVAALPEPAAPETLAAEPPVTVRPAGRTVRLQVAALRAENGAHQEFQRLQRRFPAELGGLGVSIVRADLGAKGIFFRVQAGPVDEARANAICQTLKAQSVGCLIVR